MSFASVTYQSAPCDSAAWPAGEGFVATQDLPCHLESVAQSQARVALEKCQSSDLIELIGAALAGGAAIELLLRAMLAGKSLALLAEKGETHTLLMLAGNAGAHQKGGYRDARSLGVSECLRAIKNIPGMPNISDVTVQTLLSVRNSAAHMGILSRDDLQEAMGCLVDLVSVVLPTLSCSEAEFWGADLSGYAIALRERQIDERRVKVEARRVQAAQLATTIKLGMADDSNWNIYVERAQESAEPDVDEPDEFVVSKVCPACGEDAWLTGTVERTLHIYVENFHDHYRTVEVTGHPNKFSCGVCRLELSGLELAALSLGEVYQLGEDETAPELDDLPFESGIAVVTHRPGRGVS